MAQVRDKVVLITGGTSGIGLALAEALLENGAAVAVCARSTAALDAFGAAHPQALALQADVTEPAYQAAVLDSLRRRFGRLDILINNAGRLVERDFMQDALEPASLATEIALNLTAPIQLTAATLRQFPQLQAIVFITSGYALVSPRRSPTYGAAKAGLRAFAKALRRQGAARSLHVLEVLPPVVDTPATAHREVKKISPREVALATLKALADGREEALIGQTRLLPTLLRLAPRKVETLVAET